MQSLSDTLIHLASLAHALEREGRYNNAKLIRAAARALLARAAHQHELATDLATLARESANIVNALESHGLLPELLGAIRIASDMLAQSKLPMYAEAPDPLVCRTCGHVVFDKTEMACPVCGAWPETFERIRPTWWLDALNPITVLALLRTNPERLTRAVSGMTDELLQRASPDGGWSWHELITHWRDAQDVLAFRVNLLIDEDNPVLESKSVWEWASDATRERPTTQTILQAYLDSRASTIALLEDMPLKNWWRTGRHREFGNLTLMHTASYFAAHETSHGTQFNALLARASE